MSTSKKAQPFLIHVTLEPSCNPPVQLDHAEITVSGPTQIIWEADADSPVKDFYFLKQSVNFVNGPGFIGKGTLDHDKRYGVFNTFAFAGDFGYTLMVEHRGKYYSTGSVKPFGRGGPCIRNK